MIIRVGKKKVYVRSPNRPTREEAEAAENGTQEESIEEEGPETKAGWGIGFQQTEKNTKSPQKKSYSSGEGWSKNKDD